MSRWNTNSDLDYLSPGVRFTRPCEGRGCDQEVSLESTSVFCADCRADHEEKLIAQLSKALNERRAS
jgi:hypothetical protein